MLGAVLSLCVLGALSGRLMHARACGLRLTNTFTTQGQRGGRPPTPEGEARATERGPRGMPDALPWQPSLDEVLPGDTEVSITRSRRASAAASSSKPANDQ